MKKLQFILVIILLLVLFFSSCGKAVENPIEKYTLQGAKDKWVFNEGIFGLDLHRSNRTPYWQRCEKIGNNKNGTIFIDNISFNYEVDRDSVMLSGKTDSQDLLEYSLILDRKQRNVFGIFQK
jgi:hypothetical protein